MYADSLNLSHTKFLSIMVLKCCVPCTAYHILLKCWTGIIINDNSESSDDDDDDDDDIDHSLFDPVQIDDTHSPVEVSSGIHELVKIYCVIVIIIVM